MRLLAWLSPVLLATMVGCRGPSASEIDADEDGSFSDVDCNDSDAAVNPGAVELCDGIDNDCDGLVDNVASGQGTVFYADGDGDGFGRESTATEACDAPAGFVDVAGDCDDAAAAVYPDAPEEDCTDPVDYNCDGSVGYADADADGFAACEDCDDANPQRSPVAVEVCDGVDDDCDGVVDNEAVNAGTWYTDADADGFGDPLAPMASCDAPQGAVADATDCDDAAADVHPGATELCNSVDDNCNDVVDEDASDATTWYADLDGDGHAGTRVTVSACAAPEGYLSAADDCDDLAAITYPGADELCDGRDNNCDTAVDENAVDASTWYADADDDGYGDAAATTLSCSQPSGTVARAGDCDDAAAGSHPGAVELCDGRDNDCDTVVDEDAANAKPWYADADADGFGDASSSVAACDAPSGHVADKTDCNDGASTVHPGADEVCNSVDDNCNSIVDESAVDAPTWYADLDGDGHAGTRSTVKACSAPAGHLSSADDCDDVAANVYPGADEVCDGRDNNCDTVVDDNAVDAPTWYADADADGFGNPSSTSVACSAPSGTVGNSGDCNDAAATDFPGAAEYCDGVDNNCNQVVDESPVDPTIFYLDADGDGVGSDRAAVCLLRTQRVWCWKQRLRRRQRRCLPRGGRGL